MKRRRRCPSCQYTHADVMGCRPPKKARSQTLSVSLPAKQSQLTPRENSSYYQPPTRRPARSSRRPTRERFPRRAPNSRNSIHTIIFDKDSDDEEEPRHSTRPALGDQVQEIKCEECFIRYRDADHEPGECQLARGTSAPSQSQTPQTDVAPTSRRGQAPPAVLLCENCGSTDSGHTYLDCQNIPEQTTREMKFTAPAPPAPACEYYGAQTMCYSSYD